MQQPDLYEILGVSRGADDAEIKKAYRQRAKDLHPDRNKDDPEAAERFKEVNVAHDILKDPQKRAAYDRFGHAAFTSGGRGGPYAGADFGDHLSKMFEELFGGGMGMGRTGQAESNRGEDLAYNLAIELREAYAGRKVSVDVRTEMPCESCESTGSASRTAPTNCQDCGGAGVVRAQRGFMTMERTCPSCRGRGRTIADPCRACGGSGRARRKRKLEVSIPAGVDTGNRLQLRGQGNAGIRGGPPGDLYIEVNVNPDPQFERSGPDLHSFLSVPMTTAALGGKVQVPTIDGGWTSVTVPKGIQTGRQLKLRDKGMPRVDSKSYGDLYLEVGVATPVDLTRKQRELLEAFAREESKDQRRRA